MLLRISAIIMALLGCFAAAGGAVEDDVTQAEKSWAAAVTHADMAALDNLLASGLIYTHSGGVVESKSVYTGRLKSGSLKYEALEHEGVTVHPYGDAAILHCKMRMRGVSDGQAFNSYAVVTHVWVKRGNAWKLAAHQATKLP